jgi:GntR family transcriptional regulator/MocR family aminotransferase
MGMNGLSINLDSFGGIPLYEQIYCHIKREIQEGQLKALTRLPSTRALALHLQVSRSTVDLAYEQLLCEGYIESVPYKGYYVCEIEGLFRLESSLIRQKQVVKEEKIYDYNFSPNGIDLENFPYNTWRKIMNNLLLDHRDGLFQLGASNGEWEIRDTIAQYLHHARGVKCDPGQMIIGAGNDYLLMLLSQIIGVNYTIAMENPTYTKAYRLFDNLGYRMNTVNMDEQGMDVEELEKTGADIAYVMPSHQYPLGTVMPIKRRMELLKWASRSEHRYIIEDDYDSEFRYKGKPIPSLQGSDHLNKVIYIGTFSKSVAPAIRISYLVLPQSLLSQYKEKENIFSATVSKMDQMIMNTFILDGYFERHLNKMRGIYKGKHDVLIREIKKIKSVDEIFGEYAGVHILVRFRKEHTQDEMIAKAEEAGIKVYGLSEYYTNLSLESGYPTVIMGYANLSEEEIEVAVRRLQEVW